MLEGNGEGHFRVLLFPFPMLLPLRPYAFFLSRSLTVFCLIALCCLPVPVLLRYTQNSI